MSSIKLVESPLIFLAVLLAVATGCQPNAAVGGAGGTQPTNGVGEPDKPVKAVIQDAVSTGFTNYLHLIQDPTASLDSLESTLTNIAALPAQEAPEFWVNIVNDNRYSEDHRRDCLVVFFRRFVHAGTRLNWFHQLTGTSHWFNETNIITATAFNKIPIKERAACVYMYQPALFRSQPSKRYEKGRLGAVFFSLSQYVSPQRLALILDGQQDDGGCRIVEIQSRPGGSAGDPPVPHGFGTPKAPFFEFRQFQ
jgi:hypothetical protein